MGLLNFNRMRNKEFNKQKSLLKYVEKVKKTDKGLQRMLKKKSKPIWIPSLRSFFKIFLPVLIFWLIVNPHYLYSLILSPLVNLIGYFLKSYSWYPSLILLLEKFFSNYSSFFQLPLLNLEPNRYQILIAIHAGIGAMLIGLAFFVAQSLNDKNDPERGRVLLYKSKFFPLLTAEILILFSFLCGDPNILTLFPIIVLSIFTMCSMGGVISILIRDYKMEQAKKKMFFEVIKNNFLKIMDIEITKRIGNNILYEKIENHNLLNINPYFDLDKNKYIEIRSKKGGIFCDFIFNKFDKFVNELKKLSIKNKNITEHFEESKTDLSPRKQQGEDLGYVIPTFFNEIKRGNLLFKIKRDAIKNGTDEYNKHKIIQKLENLANEVFMIRANKIQDPKEESKLEISKLKDRCIEAIEHKQVGELSKMLNLYQQLVIEFYKYLKSFGGGFSREQAEFERRLSPFEKFEPLEWLTKDCQEIFKRGMKSGDEDIVGRVSFFPIALACRAMENNDHLLFQEFTQYPNWLYIYAHEELGKKNDKLADLMFDRTWRYLKELADFYLIPMLKKNIITEEDFRGYTIYLLKIFQTLLKSSFDHKDQQNFEKFLNTFCKLYKHLDSAYYEHDREKRRNILKFINRNRNQVLYGLLSWIFSKWEKDKKNSNFEWFFNHIKSKLPQEIEGFTRVFLDCYSFKAENFWGWDLWEIQEKEEGEVHSVQILKKFEIFFAVHSLSIIKSKSNESLQAIVLPYNRTLLSLVQRSNGLMKILNSIQNNENGYWNFVLEAGAIAKVEILKKLLNKAKDNQQSDDNKKQREIRISEKKVNQFRKNMTNDFYAHSTLRNILKNYELFDNKTNKQYKGDIKRFGINTIFDKVPFFGDEVEWHVDFIGAEDSFGFGRDLAEGENVRLIEIIKKRCNEIKREEFETILNSSINKSEIIIIAINNCIWPFFTKSNNFKQKWQKDYPKNIPEEATGVYWYQGENIPIFESYNNKKEKYILVLDKTKIGKLIQYSPLEENENVQLLNDIFVINVQEFLPNSDLINRFIKNPPDWLKDIGNVVKQSQYLQENVLIHIFERYEFRLHQDFSGYYFIVPDET